MGYEDASQNHSAAGSDTVARADVDTLAPGSYGPASGNAITGAGTTTGASGADKVATPPGTIVEVHGAGGATSASGGTFQAVGQYGVLSMDTTGNFNYVRNAGTPDGVRDVFNYTLADSSGANSSTTLTIDIGQVAAAAAGQGVVALPAGVELSDIHVNGRDLVVNLPDGTQMVIPNGAVFVPDIVIGDVQVPPTNLAALLVDSEPQPAAGQPTSPGGNWDEPPPPLDPGVPLGDLIPPTELSYSPPEFKLPGQFEDTQPTVVIEPHDLAPGAVDAVDSVNEKGLPSRDGDLPNEPAGSGEIADGNGLNNSDTSETTNGTIVFTAQDGLASITIDGADGVNNAVSITAGSVGTTIQGQYGVLTITGVNLANGTVTYTYTLTDNTHGDTTADHFTVVVTDTDGDAATATLTVDIIDDVPTARNDTDAITGQNQSTDGNVMTGVGTTSGNAGADTVGADNATVTGVHPGTSGGFTAVPQDGGGVTIHGTFGDLVLHDDGSYTYTRTDEHAGGTDVFTYQLTDGDGDTSTATLTIEVPQVNQPPIVAEGNADVSEEGLQGGNQDTMGNPSDNTNSTTDSGDVIVSDPDGDPTTATLGLPVGNPSLTSDGVPITWALSDNGHTLTGSAGAGNTIITITIQDNGQYNVTLSGPIDHPDPNSEDLIHFTVPVSVSDGIATVPTSITVTVEDDSPTISNVAAGASVSVDETTAGSPAGFPISATSDTAVITATTSVGADTPGTTTYGLTITGGSGTSSGLATAIGDHPITLVQTNATTITGTYQDGGTQTAFTIHINADGTVTLTENVPLEHLVDGSTPSAYNDTLDLSGLVNATITVTDADQDSASASVAIGGNIVFYDDGPSISVSAGSDANVLLNTFDANTIGSASDSDQSTANFGGVFTIGSSSGGGDGAAGSPVWTYTLGAVDGTDSGLTQDGHTIYLYQLANGSVVGSTSATEGGVNSGNEVFSVTVNSSGQVTLTQFSEIDHPLPGSTSNFDTQTVTLADGAVTLTGSATITDNDGDTATDSQTINIGSNLIFHDDGPSVTNVEAGAGVSVDETTAGSPAGFPISATSSTAVITATTSVGADTPGTTAYGLTITGGDGTSSGLATAIGDHPITLHQTDATTITGTYTDGSGTHDAFTIHINSDGTVTLTEDVPLEHLVDGSTPSAYNDTLDLSGLINATITVTDFDGDTASGSVAIGGNIVFYDDGPSISVSAGADADVLLNTYDAQTIGAASDSDQSTANFGGVFSIGSSSGGGDGAAGSPVWTFTLGAVDHTDSGLTQDGHTIYLYQLANGSVVGSTSGTEAGVTGANTVFSVTVNSSGQVTLTQFSEIDHPLPGSTSNFDTQTVHLADGAVTLTGSATITDNDGDTATDSKTVNIGANLIFHDDGPSVTNVQAGAGVSVDETTAGSPAGFPISATSLTAVVTATTSVGADTPGTTTYGLTITGGDGTSSGLATAIGDHPITLHQTDATTITGTYTDGSGTHDAFTIHINSNGTVTLTEDVPLEHLVDGSTPSAYNDTLDLSGLINATITVTDFDGDSATGSTAIGGNIVFYDDGPSISVSAGADANVLLNTYDAQTIGVNSSTDQSTANFGGVFSIGSSSGGGDGAAGSPVWTFTLGAVDHTDSGLTQGGNTIYLYQLANGSVVGSTSGTEGGVNSGNTVFSVTVNSSGQVTLTQFSEIDHPLPGSTSNFDTQTVTLADGAVTLTGSATITDNDGDTATSQQTVNIGANLVFHDDGPHAATNGTAVGTVTLDETRPEGTDTTGGAAPSGDASATINFSSNFVTGSSVNYGADGPGSVTYSLHLNGSNVASGLYALDNTDTTTSDLDGYGQGGQIVLNQSGNTITGSYNGVNYFTITIDPSTGVVTFTELHNIWNPTAGSSAAALDEIAVLTTAAASDIQVVQTVTDFDGDTSTASINVGQNVFGIEDDGPRFGTVDTTLQIDNSGTHPSGTGDMQFTIGTDSPNGPLTGANPAQTQDDINVSNFVIQVNGSAAQNVVLTPGAENASTANYTFAFDYDTGTGVTDHETGTLVFDKVAGTYTVTLDHPIEGFTTLETAQGTAFTGYQFNTATVTGSQPDVAVTTIQAESAPGAGDGFYVQFTGFTAGNGSHETIGDGTAGTWVAGDLFSEGTSIHQSWVSATGSSNGVAGDTVNGPDGLNFNLYSSDPQGFFSGSTGNLPTASAQDMFLRFDGVSSSDDFIVVLKLWNDSNHNGQIDAGDTFTTKALVVKGGDMYLFDSAHEAGTVAALSGTQWAGVVASIVADGGSNNNDGLVIIESNDYNAPGENWSIVGAQVINTADGVTGTGIDLNGAVGASGGSTGTESLADASNTAPMKITNIGFQASTTTAQNATISFDVGIHDADGDTASTSVTVNVGTQSAAAVNTLMSTNTTSTTNTGNHSLVDTKSLLASNDNTGDHRAFSVGNNAALMGALAAAGITQAEIGVHQSLWLNHGDIGSSLNTTSFASETLAPTGTHTVNDVQGTELFGKMPLNTDVHAASVNTHMPTFHGDFHGSVGGDPGIIDRSELPQGTQSTAGSHGAAITSVTAPTVVMPSAQQLAGAHGHGQVGGQANTVAGTNNAQHDEVVGKVLADALHGGHGHGPDIMGLIDAATGHNGANSGVQTFASQGHGIVPMGDIAHFGGFAMMHLPHMMEMQIMAHEAAVAHS